MRNDRAFNEKLLARKRLSDSTSFVLLRSRYQTPTTQGPKTQNALVLVLIPQGAQTAHTQFNANADMTRPNTDVTNAKKKREGIEDINILRRRSV